MAAQTIAENPGASNPQISKILGERWAQESDEVKAQWKKLANEESKRHRQQYPDYRFQPKRRGSKTQTRVGDDDSIRCSRCNGLRVSSSAGLPGSAKGRSDAESSTPTQGTDESGARRGSISGEPSTERGVVRSAEEAGNGRIMSPEPKRRRLMNSRGPQAVTPIQVWTHDRRYPGYPNHMSSPAGQDSWGGGYTHVSTPLPQPGGMARQQVGAMPPPPRPSAGGSWSNAGYQVAGRAGPMGDSVRLPPLKTAITPSASPAQDLDSRFGYTPITAGLGISGGRDSPEKSAAEQIMSIPFTRKMAVASKISPPLARAGTEGRGAIIAIEGSREKALKQVSHAVEKSLRECQDAALQSCAVDSKFEGAATGEDPSTELQDLMPSIFQDILEWHKKSKEIVSYVLGRQSISPTEEGRASPSDQKETMARTKTPVALIKDGFSLTMSDKFACATSHSLKNYGPVDHWQWMATLWRGIVGPDLVIYVKACSEEDMEKLKTVEFQKQLGVMVVRVPVDKSLDEATERRLKFEVIEWITDVWPKGTPRG